MKNKAFLSILEQICMILVFVIAAALCLRGFSLANKKSRDRDTLDMSVTAAQNTAEVLKSNKGDLSLCADVLSGSANEDTLTVLYDEDGHPTKDGDKEYFKLIAVKQEGEHPLTESALIRVISGDETVFELTVVWAKGGNNEG